MSLVNKNSKLFNGVMICRVVGDLNREMSLIGKIHPECVDVVNPYHECTEICLRKIAEGKGRKVTKKKSGLCYCSVFLNNMHSLSPCPKNITKLITNLVQELFEHFSLLLFNRN